MTEPLIIAVTQDDIDTGRRGVAHACPFAIAGHRLFPWAEYVASTHNYIVAHERRVSNREGYGSHFEGRWVQYKLPADARNAIASYDRYNPMYPGTYTLIPMDPEAWNNWGRS